MSRSRRTPPAVLACVGALAALTACDSKSTQAGDAAIAVQAGDDSCQVATDTAGAGNVTFEITNQGTKVTEFYLYGEGDRIMGEVENISPGLTRRLIVQVPDAGRYQTACKPGMAGNGIRADFTVTGGATQPAPGDVELTNATTSYTGYITTQVGALHDETQKLVDLLKSKDVPGAKAQYAVARVFYERVEPVAEKFGDLDPLIDVREADLEQGRPFTGFHRLEKDLWSTGLQPDSAQAGDDLVANIGKLQDKVKTLQLTPLDLANGAKSLLDEVATGKITGEEEHFSHLDLVDFRANVDGSKAAIQALRPVLQQRDPQLVVQLDGRFADVDRLLEAQRSGDGYKLYTELSPDQVKQFSSAVDALSEPLSKVAEVVAK